MPSEPSLPKQSCGVLHTDAQGNPVPCPDQTFNERLKAREPKGSEGSSRDELCEIPHETIEEEDACEAARLAAKAPPAEGETAGEPECNGICLFAADIGVPEAGNVVAYGHPDCAAHGNPEPEAPEEHICKPGATLYYCPTAGEVESDCHGGFDACCSNPEQHVQVDPPPPPRPPYALTYVTGSGARIQIALPGEATTGVFNGALIITHPSGVLGIEEIKPYEED